MLVITRKVGERLDLTEYSGAVQILDVRNGKVRLGCSGEGKILRGELSDQETAERQRKPTAAA